MQSGQSHGRIAPRGKGEVQDKGEQKNRSHAPSFAIGPNARGVNAARIEASRCALSSSSRPLGFSSSRSARTSSGDELGKVPWRDPNCVRVPDVNQLTRGTELVNRGG